MANFDEEQTWSSPTNFPDTPHEIVTPTEPHQQITDRFGILNRMQWITQQWRRWRLRFRRRWNLNQPTWKLAGGSRGKSALWKARAMQIGAVLMIGGLIGGILLFLGMVAWVANDLPNPNKVQQDAASTKIVDRYGEVLYDVHGDEYRVPIEFSQAPEYLKQATIAVEDKDFYKHGGFDPLTIIRIPYNYVFRGGRVVGGSTLTQQLVKNSLLSNERTIIRKLKEFILALEIERQYTKDEILLLYLNNTPYGGTAVGAGAAAQQYFGKPIQDLTLVESAILAGLPQRPTAYSPFLGRTTEEGEPLWKWRTKGVLRRMREDNYISQDLENQALQELDTVVFKDRNVAIKAPHFVFYVLEQLEEMYGAEVVERGGLVVKTTLDLPYYEETQAIVQEEIDKVTSFKITNGAAVVMDPRNGEILSMVGSKNYFAEDIPGKFNVAVNGLRQPGSSIKPVTYATALSQGMTPASMLVDAFTIFAPNDQADAYEPKNYDGKFRGPMSLRRALAESNNVVAVKLLAKVGVRNMLAQAHDMGFVTLEPTDANMRRFGLSVTLGGAEVHLIDSVTAYSAFANGGHRVQPVAILEITDADGKNIFQHRDVAGEEVFSPEVAYLINSILSDDQARSGAFGTNSQLNVQNRPIAVKTGTTNDQRDNWTIGWSRSTIVGVWVGNNDNSPMTRVASGITGASPIWRRMMLAAIESGRTTDPWDVPTGVEQVRVDRISGYPAHDDLESKEEWVIKGTVPSASDPIHQKLRLCHEQNKLATAADIQRGQFYEKVFVTLREDDPISQDGRNRWQEGIDAWISQQPDQDTYRPPTESCNSAGDVITILKQPENEKKYDTTDIKVEVEVHTEEKVDRVEIMVNGEVKETLRNKPYQTTLNLPRGRYTIRAKAVRTDAKEGLSGEAKIGTGGEDWKAPDPTPTPTPTPVPTPTPTPTPFVPPGQL